MINFKDTKVIVVGLGLSGYAASKKLSKLGANVLVTELQEQENTKKYKSDLEQCGIQVKIGEHNIDYLKDAGLIVVSPGVPNYIPFLEIARGRNIPIWSEIELAYQFIYCPIIGVTGTNGKSTTTMMIGEMLKAAGYHTVVAGNIGNPAIAAAEKLKGNSMMVLELSSFQLENIISFKPHVSVFLNITQDHLDWHNGYENYLSAKSKIFSNQTFFDYSVINYDDPVIRKITPVNNIQIIPFTRKMQLESGIYIQDNKLISHFHKKETICLVDEISLKGEHNLENAMAAAGAVLSLGVPVSPINKVLKEFKGLEHRLEFVASINNVDFYNDSKATNPDSTIKALTAFNKPIVLLLGGHNKGSSFKELDRKISKSTVRDVLIFGEAAEQINQEIKSVPTKWIKEYDFDKVIVQATSMTNSGDVVLLSPACASYDMFKDYEDRGEQFKLKVKELESKNEVA